MWGGCVPWRKAAFDLNKACLPDTVPILLLYRLHGLETPSPQFNPCHVSTLNSTHSTGAGSICFFRLLFSRLRQICLALCFGAMRTMDGSEPGRNDRARFDYSLVL